MKSITIQVQNDAGEATEEQTVPCRNTDEVLRVVKTILDNTPAYEPKITFSLQPGLKGRDAHLGFLHSVCSSTKIYNYDDVTPVGEYFDRLEPRHKKMLYALAFYSTANAYFISGYTCHTINSMRQEVYERTDFRSVKELRQFCIQLEKTGIKLEREPKKPEGGF